MTAAVEDGQGVIDLNEYGVPITNDRYRRLGAGSGSEKDVGLYVRFEPGFGLNVHVGVREGRDHDWRNRPQKFVDFDRLVISGQGWERLCSLVDEWRERIAAVEQSASSPNSQSPTSSSEVGSTDA